MTEVLLGCAMSGTFYWGSPWFKYGLWEPYEKAFCSRQIDIRVSMKGGGGHCTFKPERKNQKIGNE